MISKELIIHNFPRGKVTIVGGRPAMGKSSFAASLALNLAQHGKKSVFFSLEMSKEQLIRRMRMQVGDENYASSGAMIIINDNPSAKLPEIEEQLNKESADYVFIDYLQLIHSEFEASRSEVVAHIMDKLKQWAEEFKVTIIIFSQLIREWPRGLPRPQNWGKQPSLSSLGSLFPDALNGVNIKLIHRPKYYEVIEEKDSNKIIDEKMVFITYKGDECIVSHLNFNTETTEMTI